MGEADIEEVDGNESVLSRRLTNRELKQVIREDYPLGKFFLGKYDRAYSPLQNGSRLDVSRAASFLYEVATAYIAYIESEAARKRGWLTGPETEAHKALKNWVAKNPRVIESTISFQAGETEWLFASSDRADVMFKHDDGCIAVEVKASEAPDTELKRGIYQCVKYGALLRAELKAKNKVPNGLAVLVTERRLPSKLQNLADLLGVRVISVEPISK